MESVSFSTSISADIVESIRLTPCAVFNVNPNDMRMLSVEARPFFPLQLRRLFDMPAFPHQVRVRVCVCVCSSKPLRCEKRGDRRFVLFQKMIIYFSEGV